MGCPTPSQSLFRFRTFVLDLQTRELRRSGIRLNLHGQPIAILKMLLEHPGQMISRESLRHALWSDNTLVEFEHGLNSNINRLRTALGDHAGTPRFIETVPGLGYRFIAPVNSVSLPVSAGRAIGVAVLPFTCIGDVDTDFAYVLTADVVVQLVAASSSIRVVSPLAWTSSGMYSRVARQLHVDYLVAGAIWRNPDASRFSVQLLRVSDSCCIWGGTYVVTDPDLFLQLRQIAADISAQLRSASA